MTDDFYEEIPVELHLGREASPGEINRVLRSLGFRLHYDVYALPRPGPGPHPNWQSENVVEVEMIRAGVEVDAQDPCDTIRMIYPLATIDSPLIDTFLKALHDVSEAFGCALRLDGSTVELDDVSNYLTDCVSQLLQKWGEEPGSKSLRAMIMENLRP
ncbi:MAG: hypothetical protein IV100_11840 [Myxococcales bacterium]|nr:hypothetical protein [Myxococcales bacterium]